MKRTIYLMLMLVASLSMLNCNKKNEHSSNNSNLGHSIRITKDSLFVSSKSDNIFNMKIEIENQNVLSIESSKSVYYSLLNIIRNFKNKNELALVALKNNNNISLKIHIENFIDTTITYAITPYYDEDSKFSINGKCAPLISQLSNQSQTVELKKWLFRKNEHIENEQVRTLSGIVNQLSRSETVEYTTNSTIPVVNSIKDLKYSIKSGLKADYYVLYASSGEDINSFVEEVIANDFSWCSKSLGSKVCYQSGENNGYKCICLLGINKDWSYKIQPLGLIAIDNIAPGTEKQLSSSNSSSILFPDNIKVLLPSNKPEIYGMCNVDLTNSQGNGIECNCSFEITFLGDVKSVTIKRTKSLCYDTWTHRVENKVIDLKNRKSPYVFTYLLHFKDGDNIIPIIVEDNHGNKREFEINKRATFERKNTQDINVWNY